MCIKYLWHLIRTLNIKNISQVISALLEKYVKIRRKHTPIHTICWHCETNVFHIHLAVAPMVPIHCTKYEENPSSNISYYKDM